MRTRGSRECTAPTPFWRIARSRSWTAAKAARRCATVGRAHLNFDGACHGGALFALADSAFGLASNSHGVRAAGIDAHIAYHVAAREATVLLARAAEVSRGKKLATYRVDAERDDGALIASFTGTVFRASEDANASKG